MSLNLPAAANLSTVASNTANTQLGGSANDENGSGGFFHNWFPHLHHVVTSDGDELEAKYGANTTAASRQFDSSRALSFPMELRDASSSNTTARINTTNPNDEYKATAHTPQFFAIDWSRNNNATAVRDFKPFPSSGGLVLDTVVFSGLTANPTRNKGATALAGAGKKNTASLDGPAGGGSSSEYLPTINRANLAACGGELSLYEQCLQSFKKNSTTASDDDAAAAMAEEMCGGQWESFLMCQQFREFRDVDDI